MKSKIRILALAVAVAFTGAAYGQTSNSNSTAGSSSSTVANPVNNNMGNGSSTSSSGSQAGASSQTTGNSVGVTVQQDFRGPASQTIDSRVSGSTTQNLNVNNSGTTTENTNSHVSGSVDTNVHYSGSQTIKNVPNVIAPNILPTSPCMGSSSLGGAVAGFGIGGGTSWKDTDCGYRETARVFMQAGRMDDGIAVLCASEYASAAPVCQKAKKAEAEAQIIANARQEMIRTGNDAGRNATTYGTMGKSELDRQLTVAAMQPTKSQQQAANCAVARQAGDLILAERFGCVGK